MSASAEAALLAARPRLLVVDDEPDMCAFVAEVGEQSGYASTSATTADQLQRQLTQQFAVIVLDLDMPGVDGLEAMRVMAERNSAVRVILMSGHDAEMLENARRLAAARGLSVSASFTKPLRAATLSRALGRNPGPSGGAALQRATPQELQRAIIDRQLVMHYQPQVALDTGAWIGVEALVRWQHPVRGLLMPGTFVPQMENMGLSQPLTRLVADITMNECLPMAGQCGFEGRVSMNFPPAAVTDPVFPDEIVRLVERRGWPRNRLCFEITETSVALEPVAAAHQLKRLREHGCLLSIDDFGTGHSSLLLLGTLPLSEMKIDKSFVLAALLERTARVIVENSVKLAKELGLSIVADGVETREHYDWLKGLGCDAAQGDYIARPMPVGEIPAWARRWSRTDAPPVVPVAPAGPAPEPALH